jgi:hypothetical protein
MALGCSGASPELAGTLSDRAAGVLAHAPDMYAPTGASPANPETESLRAQFEGALDLVTRQKIAHDPALDLVAAAVAEETSDHGVAPSRALHQWLFWRSGSTAIFESSNAGWVGRGNSGRRSAGAARAMLGSLDEWAKAAAGHANALPGRGLVYGLSRVTEGRVTSQAVVFGTAVFDTAPLPKTYAPGATLTMRLGPRHPIRDGRFLFDRGAAIDEQPLLAGPDGALTIAYPLPAVPGRYFVQIQGPAPVRRTLLFLPIQVGVPEPTRPDAFIEHPPPAPQAPATWQAWLAARYDAERARVGRSPVELSDVLGALATTRSATYSATRRLAREEHAEIAAQLGADGAPVVEQVLVASSGSEPLFHLLEPAVRQRVVFGARVLLGASASPLPAAPGFPPVVALVEETVVPTPP